MPAPSKLSIATSSVSRLLKEEASYHEEQSQQETRIHSLSQTATGENAEFEIKQEQKALEQTKAIFPSLRERIAVAVSQLEQRLTTDGSTASEEDVAKAKDALNEAKAAGS